MLCHQAIVLGDGSQFFWRANSARHHGIGINHAARAGRHRDVNMAGQHCQVLAGVAARPLWVQCLGDMHSRLPAAAHKKPGGKAYAQADQQRNEEDSHDPSILPVAAHPTDTTPFHIPNAIAHTLLLPQSTCSGRCGEWHLNQCSCCSKLQTSKLEQSWKMKRFMVRIVAECEFLCAEKTVEMYFWG